MYQRVGKRLFDGLLALTGLLLMAPVMVLIALILTIVNRGKPIFRQTRPGQFGRLFGLCKFKTMTDQRDETGKLLPDAHRLTSIGRWLRRTSLDELPQLINVLAGDMSLVGPRPLLADYLPLYTPEQQRRHAVKPGLTGWAQTNGRNALTWDEKFALDTWYVDNQSWRLDLKIMWLTVVKLIGGSGANRSETDIMPRFTGSAT